MRLTVRQEQIVRGLWDGLSVKEIAAVYGLRPMTISQHLELARRQQGVRSTVLLLRRCVQEGVLTP